MAVRLSREEEYGILALLDLAINLKGGPAQVREIAKRQCIPQRFLEQIFSKLRIADIVTGKRGPKGGYSLLKKLDEISLSDVIKALRPVLQEDKRTKLSPLLPVVDKIWKKVQEDLDTKLKDVTLIKICSQINMPNEELSKNSEI